jgi:hypothetical protein
MNTARGSIIFSGDSLDFPLLHMPIAMTNITAKKTTVIFVVGLFMIVPLLIDRDYALLFSRRMKLICIISEQSIAAIIYDGDRLYFGIRKIVLTADFPVEFQNKKKAELI